MFAGPGSDALIAREAAECQGECSRCVPLRGPSGEKQTPARASKARCALRLCAPCARRACRDTPLVSAAELPQLLAAVPAWTHDEARHLLVRKFTARNFMAGAMCARGTGLQSSFGALTGGFCSEVPPGASRGRPTCASLQPSGSSTRWRRWQRRKATTQTSSSQTTGASAAVHHGGDGRPGHECQCHVGPGLQIPNGAWTASEEPQAGRCGAHLTLPTQHSAHLSISPPAHTSPPCAGAPRAGRWR